MWNCPTGTWSGAFSIGRPSRWPIRTPRCGRAWHGPPARRRLAELARGRSQRLRGHQRRNPPGAQPGASAADPGDARSRGHSPPRDSDPRGHGPAPPEPRRRTDRDGRPLGGRELSHRKPSRPAARRAHVPWPKPARRARLDRLALRRCRLEDHHRPDRAALHGRLFRRAKADLPRPGRLGDGAGMARAAISSNIPTPATAASTATPSTKRTRPSAAWPAAISSSTW